MKNVGSLCVSILAYGLKQYLYLVESGVDAEEAFIRVIKGMKGLAEYYDIPPSEINHYFEVIQEIIKQIAYKIERGEWGVSEG